MNVIDKLATYEDQISPGISACVGCNIELTLRTCMKVLGPNTIFAIPPGCMGGVGVVGWDKQSGAKTPVFFPLLDNVASMLAGIKLHYEHIGRHVNVVAFAGDGASVDAGMQCLSGAAERGDKLIYICYDNEGYMNTGYQRSGSTSKVYRYPKFVISRYFQHAFHLKHSEVQDHYPSVFLTNWK